MAVFKIRMLRNNYWIYFRNNLLLW